METLGVFSDVDTAAAAVERLIGAGFPEERITSLTSAPYPDGVLTNIDRSTWFSWFTPLCGVIGALAGFLLAAGTAWVYPVQTGDKPIISSYPTGIVTYEITMLLAMVGTMVGMFLHMGLPPAGKRVYDPAVGDGFIGISVVLPSADWQGKAEEVMLGAGAVRVTSEATL